MKPKKSDDQNPTRWSLVNRLKNLDDQQSWQDFFDKYWKLIHSVARQAGLTESEAQDAVQETVISVAKMMPGFKADPEAGSFRGWLLRLTRRRIVDQFRKRPPRGGTKISRPGETSRTATVERVPDPRVAVLEAVWNAEWQKNLLDTALERLKNRVNPKQYQIFHLLVEKGLPPEQVAQLCRVTVDNVYLTKHRTSLLLKNEIQKLEGRKL